MKFVYTPEGAEPRSWDFDPTKLLNVEAEEIERRTGMTYGDWTKAVMKGSMTALHGLLYVLLKRSNPGIKYDEVTFTLAELDFEVEGDDAQRIVETLRRRRDAGDIDPVEQALLERLEQQGAGAPDGESDPKD